MFLLFGAYHHAVGHAKLLQRTLPYHVCTSALDVRECGVTFTRTCREFKELPVTLLAYYGRGRWMAIKVSSLTPRKYGSLAFTIGRGCPTHFPNRQLP